MVRNRALWTVTDIHGDGSVMARNADIRGLILFGAPPTLLAEIHGALGEGLERGALRPVIAREFPLADAARAHVAVMSPGASGKIVLIP